MKVHHIGYLVKDIERSFKAFNILGYDYHGQIYKDNIRKADILFINNNNNYIELIQPWNESKLNQIMKKYRNCAYHICYATDDLDKSISLLNDKAGWRLFLQEEIAPAIGKNAKVVFLFHPEAGIIELVQE